MQQVTGPFVRMLQHSYLWGMKSEDLQKLYGVTNLKQADFIRWASGHGVDIARSTVSRHYSGSVDIPQAYVLAYKWFFSFHGA